MDELHWKTHTLMQLFPAVYLSDFWGDTKTKNGQNQIVGKLFQVKNNARQKIELSPIHNLACSSDDLCLPKGGILACCPNTKGLKCFFPAPSSPFSGQNY